jgi:hypothetical protein
VSVRESAPHVYLRFGRGAEASGRVPAKAGGYRRMLWGCLVWYLVVIVLLVLLEAFASQQRPKDGGGPSARIPLAVGAVPEGTGRHQ